ELSRTSGGLVFVNELSWNMVSVPLLLTDYRTTSTYPAAISPAYSYSGSYQRRDTLINGIGYWVKFPERDFVDFSGAAIERESLDVSAGWNIIGSISSPIPISGVTPLPPTTLASNFFGYTLSSGYRIADTIEPGKGYWIKVSTTGKVVISSGSLT